MQTDLKLALNAIGQDPMNVHWFVVILFYFTIYLFIWIKLFDASSPVYYIFLLHKMGILHVDPEYSRSSWYFM